MGAKLKVEKKSEKNHIMPTTLSSKISLISISESGICTRAANRYCKSYKLEEASREKANNIEKIKGTMMVLRSKDMPFKYIESDGNVYLEVEIKAKEFEEAKEIITHVDEDIRSSLYTYGLVINEMDAQERLRYLHRKVMADSQNTRIDINDYIKNTNWTADIENNKVKEKRDCIELQESNRTYCYVQRMPSEHMGTVYETIKNNPYVNEIILDYDPISDMDVARKMVELYEEEAITEERPDERKYIMSGIYFTVSDQKNDTRPIVMKMQEALLPYGCKLSVYYNQQREAYKAFNTFDTARIKNMRLIQVSNATKLNPFNKEEEVEDEITSSLEEFDKYFGR